MQREVRGGTSDARAAEADLDDALRIDPHQFDVPAIGLHRRPDLRKERSDLGKAWGSGHAGVAVLGHR